MSNQKEPIPPNLPLSGHWHHGNGAVVVGTVQVAREDFDTNPSEAFKKEFWDWVCSTMNAAVAKHLEAIHLQEEAERIAREFPEPTPTIMQKVLIMGLHGTPEQQEQARRYIKHHFTF